MFSRLLAADWTFVTFIILVALFAGDQVTALIDIADSISFTKLTFEPSLDIGCKVHFFLEEIELAFADSFSSHFVALPDVLYGSVYEYIPQNEHREADDQFVEGDIINFVIPKRCDRIDCFFL